MNKLYVLYKPSLKFSGSDTIVLSFMAPDDEYVASSRYVKFLFGRKEINLVRENVRKKYVDIVSRIAATPCDGKTLRQALDMPGTGNPWWYHKVSEKQVEGDPTFNMLLQIFTIFHVAERERIDEIVVFGSPVEVIEVLNMRYKTTGIRCFLSWKSSLIRAFLSRIKYLFTSFYSCLDIKKNMLLPEIKPDVVFQGFWDWSVCVDEKSGNVNDRYFRALPDKFKSKGMKCAWFLWLDRCFKKDTWTRSVSCLVRSVTEDARLIFVQKFLTIGDILSVSFDMRPFFRYIRYSHSKKFRSIYKEEGLDLWPLFNRRLAYGFCDSSIQHNFLMERAYARAFKFYKPKVSLAFLELFLAARAFNRGAIFGSPSTMRCDMQHASYSREKTFILTDPVREFCGKPDEKGMPFPNNFFVMGELCRDILIEDGFPSQNIFVTGSARYDNLFQNDSRSRTSRKLKPARVLIVPTLNVHLDFEMVQATVLASEGLDIELYLRSHPLIKIEDIPAYKRYGKNIISSRASLEDDLNAADLVLFTYSSVAEEAFIRGIPVVRWQTNGFNGSVFRDIDVVPSAHSVESLKQIFRRFLDNPALFVPDERLKSLVMQKCFYKADGMASCRIAEKAMELLTYGENHEKSA